MEPQKRSGKMQTPKIKISAEMMERIATLLATIQDAPGMVGEACADFLAFAETQGDTEDPALDVLRRKCRAALVIMHQAQQVVQDQDVMQILLGKMIAVAAQKEARAAQAQPFTEERKASAN
jgi:hypothetical protein